MTTTYGFGYDEQAGQNIRAAVVRDTARNVAGGQPWTGAPVNLLPLSFRPTLNAMVDAGEIEIVDSGRGQYVRFVS